MTVRSQIVALSALCLLASCTTTPWQKPMAQQSQPTASRQVASETINEADAKRNLDSGVGFGIGCTKVKGQPTSVSLEFYKTGADNAPMSETYKASYIKVADLLQAAESVSNVLPGTKNRILESNGYRYLVTPSAIRVLDRNNKPTAYIADIRGTLKSTCASQTELEENGGEFGYSAQESYLPVSIVGPFISVHYTTSQYTGGAHGSAYQGFETRDSSKISISPTNKNTLVASTRYNLFDIAGEADILAALKGDKFLQKKVGAANLAAAKDTTAVHQLMVKKMNGGCDIYIPDEKKEAFSQLAIYDYDAAKGNMMVRVAYSYGCEAARGTFTQLGLSLRPTSAFASMLKAEMDAASAQSRKPYFMRYSQQLK